MKCMLEFFEHLMVLTLVELQRGVEDEKVKEYLILKLENLVYGVLEDDTYFIKKWLPQIQEFIPDYK